MKMIFKGVLLCALSLVMTPPCFAASAAGGDIVSELILSMNDKSDKDDTDALSSAEAAQRLGEIAIKGDKDVVAELIKCMKEDGGNWVERLAAQSLGKVATRGHKETISALIHVMKNSKDCILRGDAALSLGKVAEVDDEEAIVALLDIIMNDEEATYTQRNALEGIGELVVSDDEVITDLIKWVKEDDHDYIRGAAIRSLSGAAIFGHRAAIEVILDTMIDMQSMPYEISLQETPFNKFILNFAKKDVDSTCYGVVHEILHDRGDLTFLEKDKIAQELGCESLYEIEKMAIENKMSKNSGTPFAFGLGKKGSVGAGAGAGAY